MARNNGTQQNNNGAVQPPSPSIAEVAVLEEAARIAVPALIVSEKEARLARLGFATDMMTASPARKAELRILSRWATEAHKEARESASKTCNMHDLKKAVRAAQAKF